MRLTDWLELRNPDGSKRRRYAFAKAIGVTPSMVTAYCAGTMWPRQEIMEAIHRETRGAVSANDFLRPERIHIAAAAEASAA